MWFIGTDTAKDYLAARWSKAAGPGAIHFSHQLDERYFKGLTAEYRRPVYKRGKRVTVWEKKQGDANEPGDLMVYNLAAAHFLGLHKRTEHQWQALRERIVPATNDLFAPPPASAPDGAAAGAQGPHSHRGSHQGGNSLVTTALRPAAAPADAGRITLDSLARFNNRGSARR
jgi:phage terminase large subunit GpA-like protein